MENTAYVTPENFNYTSADYYGAPEADASALDTCGQIIRTHRQITGLQRTRSAAGAEKLMPVLSGKKREQRNERLSLRSPKKDGAGS